MCTHLSLICNTVEIYKVNLTFTLNPYNFTTQYYFDYQCYPGQHIAHLIMLVNNADDSTIGFIVERDETEEIVKEYEPAIMWNLSVKR